LAALRRVSGQLHRFRVSTLDSFFAQIARTFSLEMMLPTGWSALDPVQEPVMQMQAVQEMLDSHDRKTLVNLVRMLAKGESQRQVADQIVNTVRAGYGAYRVTKAEDWDQPPLPVPPSESAVSAALDAFKNPSITNKNVLKELDKLLSFALCGEWEGVIAHGVMKSLDSLTPTYYKVELPSSYVAALNTLRDAAAATLLPIRRAQTMASYDVLKAYDDRYSSLVKRQRTLAFSDVSYLLSKWMLPKLTEKPGGAGETSAVHLAEASRAGASHPKYADTGSVDPRQMQLRLDCGVSHLLLDEFQDTSPEQWRILQPLAEPLAGGPNRERSFFCVGDTKQAIYGWRGGVAEIFESVTASLAEVKQSQLNDSYRSSPEVIKVVNEVFKNLPQHSNFADCDHVARAWSEKFPEHCTSRKNLKGYVRLQNGPVIDKNLAPDEKRLAFMQFTAAQIAELTGKNRASGGVLFRRNADVATMIALLRDRGISASQDGGNPLTDSAAVELVLSLVHLSDHPGDGICAFHVGTSPLAKHLPADPRTEPHQVANWYRAQVARRGLGRAIEMVADWLANELSWWDQHRLKQLVRSAFEFQASGVVRLSDFERSVMDQRIALPTEAQVKVMTIHKSKGLEFDAVFLPDLAIEFAPSPPMLVLRGDDPTVAPNGVLRYMNEALQKTLPESWQSAFKQTKARGVFESLCLLYVAMTRARCALYLSTHPAGSDHKQNFDSLLQSVLASNKEEAGKAEAVLYELGDAEWYADLSKNEAVEADAIEESARRITLRADAQSAPVRSLRVAAPSTIGQSFEPIPLANAFSYSQSIGASFGTIIHAFFEQVRWLDDFVLDRQRLRQVALAAVSPEELRHINIDKLIDSFAGMLELRSVRAALGESRYKRNHFGKVPDRVDIDNERVINLVMNDRLISGTIDRLVVLMKDGIPYAAEIIDFKTDAYDDSMTLLWVQDRIDHHRPQLEIYARVVSELFGIPDERIATHLILLSGDEFVECRRGTNVFGGRPVMGLTGLGIEVGV
jgi:ATP-dependent exoDNAse (exonuclease V) beta subunit